MSALPAPGDVGRPWCHAYPPGVPPHYDYPRVPLTRFVDDAARDYPVTDALRFRGRSWTWSEVRDLVDRTAARLADLDVVAGERVALVSPTTPASVIVGFAVWRLGAVLVPLDPSLSAGELGERLRAVAPAVVVSDVSALDALAGVRPELPELRHVVATDPVRWLGGAQRHLAPVLGRLRGRRGVRRDDDVLVLDVLLDGGPAMIRQHVTTPATPAVVLFTGGTMRTGRPVVLTHGNLVANAFQNRLWVPDMRSGHEVLLGALPLWHAYGLTSVLLTGALAAATIVLVPRPDAEVLLDTIEQERPTIFPGVPQLYERLARAATGQRRDLSSLHVCVSGGAPLEPGTIAAFEALADGVRLRQGYGQSETSPVAIASPVYGPVDPTTVGLPVTDTVAIVRRLDAPDERAATGEIGELLVAGPQVMAGYWQGPDEPLEAPGEWLATGDLASVDESGCFSVHGRLGDVVHRRGVRIIPAVVEAALRSHPAVERAALVAVPGRDGTTAAIAVAVPRRGRRVTTDELHGHLVTVLDPETCPDHVVLRDRLPDSVLGKVLRRVLRDELAAELPDLASVRGPTEVAQ